MTTAPHYHLLLWDAERDDLDASSYTQATEDGRILFRQFWADHDLSPRMMMDAPETDADSVLDAFGRFLRHTVAVSYDTQPIITDGDGLLLLKLHQPTEELMFFPARMEDSVAAPLETLAGVMVAAATLQDIEEAETRLTHLYARLHHLFGVQSKDAQTALWQGLVNRLTGGQP